MIDIESALLAIVLGVGIGLAIAEGCARFFGWRRKQ